MTINLPDTDTLDLREYLFVDEPRVRMLVSQLRAGVPETSISNTSRSRHLRAGIAALSAGRESKDSSEDVIALSDLHVSMLEEDAEALGALADVSEEVSGREFWGRGGSRKRLKPGMLLRVTAPTRLIDPKSLTRVFRNFEEAVGDGTDNDLTQILDAVDAVDALYGEHLSLSVMPRGEKSPTMSFQGVIDHNAQFTALDRASLFSRMGPAPIELTSILQIARIPNERDESISSTSLMQQLQAGIRPDSTGKLDRRALDQVLTGLMSMIEDHGLQSAPTWPSMAVTPLAIYRHMPPWTAS